MDRRTLLAMVLIFFVFVGWSEVSRRMSPPPETPAAADTLASETAPLTAPETVSEARIAAAEESPAASGRIRSPARRPANRRSIPCTFPTSRLRPSR